MAMKMAVVSMEMTPGAIPRPDGVPEQRLLSPESWLRDGGGSGRLSGVSSIRVEDLGHEASYRRRVGVGRGLGDPHTRGAPPLGRAATMCGGPVAPLWSLSGALEASGENRVLGVDFVRFREYFLTRISETKNSRKQELALRHLVNRLVPENA